MSWWNSIPKCINPNILEIGSFQIRYYGLMYLVAFAVAYSVVLYRLKTEEYKVSKSSIQNYFVWVILGVIFGGRLGYIVFYNLKYFISHPLEIIFPFDFSDGFSFTGISGMSYHGGVIGVILVSIIFCLKNKINFWSFADLISPAIPLGYTFGRLGNFINGELYGRITNVPWGMYFPLDRSNHLRHPSQLYEAFFEGVFLFIIIWSLRKIKAFDGFLLSMYLIGYGLLRFFIEFVRQPDSHIGFIFDHITMGQVLCTCMIMGGILVIIIRWLRNRRSESNREEQNCY